MYCMYHMCVYYMYVCNAFNAFVSSVGQSNSMMDLVDNKEEIAEKNLKRFVILFTLHVCIQATYVHCFYKLKSLRYYILFL